MSIISKITTKLPTDIVVLGAFRSPLTRSIKGGLANMYPEEMLYQVVKGTVERTGIDPGLVDEAAVGTVLQTLGGQKNSAVAIKSIPGIKVHTTVNTVNRQCSSSAQALSYVSNSIRAGDYDNNLAIAAGVESMTHDYFPHRGIPVRTSKVLLETIANDEARNVLMPMGITSENVAKKYGISREDQDAFAFRSHQKAKEATESGKMLGEIIPIEARTKPIDEATSEDSHIVTKDDGIRYSISLEKLATLKPVFSDDGFTTAGNASQISDGASCSIVTTRAQADAWGLKPIGKYVGCAIAGVPSHLMGIGPAYAVPDLLKKHGLEIKDIDTFELNEAFASQSLYVIEKLGVEMDRVNQFGGAIAIGHPLGCTGTRCVATLFNVMKHTEGELGVVSMCTSTGQGYAGLFVNE